MARDTASLPVKQSACKTDPGLFWVCKGDVAFATGYLVPPDVFDMRLLPIWERRLVLLDDALLVAQNLKNQRDEFKLAFRTRDLEARDLFARNWRWAVAVPALEMELARWRQYGQQVQSSSSGWKIVAVVLGGFVLGVLSATYLAQ